MAINNLNPRRTVWFSPNEPSNKYDIWLSRNAHLDENGEPTTDSTSQRGCDYIFKIYDCGKWNPIVGFNSTAANKINTVASADGYQENHVPLFGNPSNSPDELVDGGTIGDVLYNHMTESDWEHILENGLGTAITEYSIENPFHLNYAGHQIVGGIWADRFAQSYDDTSTANKTYLAQAKYRYQQTASDYNLYVHAKDIIEAINTYQTENPSVPGIQPGGDFEWRFATTTQCGGILSDIFTTYGNPNAFKPIEVKFYPTDHQAYQSKNHRLCVSASDVIDLIDEYYQDNPDPNNPVPIPIGGTFENTSSIGSSLLHTNTNPNALKAQIYNVNSGNAGRFLRVKPLPEWPDIPSGQDAPSGGWNQVNCLVEWVDLPEGTEYSAGTGITISQENEISIDTTEASTNQVLTKTADGVGWTTPLQGATYTAGDGIEIDENQNNAISQHIERVEIGTPPSQLYVTHTGATDALLINGSSYGITVQSFDFYYNPTATDYIFTLVSNGLQFFSTNPIYLRINANYIDLDSDTNYISNITPTNNRFQKGEYFVTIQFGFVKLELITTI